MRNMNNVNNDNNNNNYSNIEVGNVKENKKIIVTNSNDII